MASVTKAVHTGFTVMDMEKTLDFWINILGATQTGSAVIEGDDLGRGILGTHTTPYVKLKMATVRLGGFEIEFFQYLTPATTPYHGDASVAGSAHIAYEVDNIEQIYCDLCNKGVTFHSSVNNNTENGKVVSKWVYLRDPNNICIEFVQNVE